MTGACLIYPSKFMRIHIYVVIEYVDMCFLLAHLLLQLPHVTDEMKEEIIEFFDTTGEGNLMYMSQT